MRGTSDAQSAQRLVSFVIETVKDSERRVRVEDVISATAAIVGELCIAAAGEFQPRRHTFTPGSHVFSDRINEILCGDNASGGITAIPKESVFGLVRDHILANGYTIDDFPSLEGVFASFAAKIGNPADWGWVPLSVPKENRPFIMPLRAVYDTRADLDKMFSVFREDPVHCLRVGTMALAQALVLVRDAIDRRVAVLLAFETVNGMAKTAPMTNEAFQRVARGVVPSIGKTSQKPWWRFW